MSAITGWRTARDSSVIGSSGLLVLGLGAMVLLAGLTTPAPYASDIVAAAAVPLAPSSRAAAHWMTGLGMLAVLLLALRARWRARSLIEYATAVV